jgi:hypothetical protein
MPDEVNITIEGGTDESHAAEPTEDPTDPTPVETQAETTYILAGQTDHTAETALEVAETALAVAVATGAELETEREITWQENLADSLREINRKLDSLMTPPAPPAETEPEPPELEISSPRAETDSKEPILNAKRGRKRSIGLRL